MTSAIENETDIWYSDNGSYTIDRTLNFWLFLVSDVFAFMCTAFVFYHLLADRQLRNAVQNHALIIILLLAFTFELIDIPLHLQYFITGMVRPAVPLTCLIWWFIDWGNYFTITVLLVYASIQRHILIFHSHLFATRRKRLIFHYLPLLVIMLFMMTFYIVAIFAPICQSTFDYTSYLCGVHACYGTIPFFIVVEQLGFGALSSCLIAIFNIALLVRVVRQKYRVHRQVQWGKQRKLAVQMVTLSLLYLICAFPSTIIYVVRLFGGLPNWANQVLPIFYFLTYYAVLLLPYMCLGNIPDLKKKLTKCYSRRGQRVAATAVQ